MLKSCWPSGGIEVDHVAVYRWVQTFTPEFIHAARPAQHATGDRWFVDETYIKVAGRWTYLYRAVDQHGQLIDVLVSYRRDAAAAREFFVRALRCGSSPIEVTSDRTPVYPRIVEELEAAARHVTEQYANNPIKDHARFKARLRPMLGLKRLASARTIAAGHAFVQNPPRPPRDHRRPAAPGSNPRRVRRPCPIPLIGRIAGESGAGTLRLRQRNSALEPVKLLVDQP
jgi:transposase, IS6 family